MDPADGFGSDGDFVRAADIGQLMLLGVIGGSIVNSRKGRIHESTHWRIRQS